MVRTFTVVVEKDEDGTCVVWAPSLPGCVSQDRDATKALKLMEDAIKGWCGSKKDNCLNHQTRVEDSTRVFKLSIEFSFSHS